MSGAASTPPCSFTVDLDCHRSPLGDLNLRSTLCHARRRVCAGLVGCSAKSLVFPNRVSVSLSKGAHPPNSCAPLRILAVAASHDRGSGGVNWQKKTRRSGVKKSLGRMHLGGCTFLFATPPSLSALFGTLAIKNCRLDCSRVVAVISRHHGASRATAHDLWVRQLILAAARRVNQRAPPHRLRRDDCKV